MSKLDSATQNNDIGLYPVKSRRAYIGAISSDIVFGEIVTWLRAVNGGEIVYRNPNTKENNITYLQDGERIPVYCDMILVTALVDGVNESTSAQNVYYETTPGSMGNKNG